MNPVLRKLKGRWFLGDFYGNLSSKCAFHCFVKSCPYSVKMYFIVRDGKKVPTSIDKVLFGFHCHVHEDIKKAENRDMIDQERALIVSGKDEGGRLARKHEQWQADAKTESKEVADKLLGKKTTVDYACLHPNLSARELQDQFPEMKVPAIAMARMREMTKRGDVTNLADLIQIKNHHLLKNDGEEIIIFDMKTSVMIMATAKLILADGTFTCVLPGFSQLYVLHAVVQNNVSFPMLFCLVKGKDHPTYTRLFRLVEELAVDEGTTIFDRPVTLMCDFEAAFIDAVKNLYASVDVKCCFFHYTKNLRTNASPVMTAIRRAAGKTSEAYKLAQRTKRRLMMLPLLPEELISHEVVQMILRAWQEGCPEFSDAFDSLVATVIRTFVGTPQTSVAPVRPRFPKHIWCVSGMCIRTNNGAESVHAQLNQKAGGRLSLFRFLKTIEEMMRSRKRIRAGCQ